MNLNELWIGDSLRVKSSGISGKYHGQKKGKVQLKVKEDIIEADASDIELFSEDSLDRKIESSSAEKGIDLHVISMFDPVLDLHYDALIKRGYAEPRVQILDWQIKIARKFLQKGHDLGVNRLRIIHGIGAGVLKNEVVHLLGELPFIGEFESSSDGGAIIAFLLD